MVFLESYRQDPLWIKMRRENAQVLALPEDAIDDADLHELEQRLNLPFESITPNNSIYRDESLMKWAERKAYANRMLAKYCKSK